MLAIPDKNETIYQVVYSSITEETKVKALKEFGFYNYFIFPSKDFKCKKILIINHYYSDDNGIFSLRFPKNTGKWRE